MTVKSFFLLAIALSVLTPSISTASVTKGPFTFSQDSFDFYYSLGGGVPTNQGLTFDNNTNNIVYYELSVPDQPSWLNTGYTTGQDLPSHPGSPTGLGASVDVGGLSVGTYNTTIFLSGSFSGSPIAIPANLQVLASGSSIPSNAVHPHGTNIVTSDGTVYRIMQGSRTPYTSAGAFLAYSYNKWSEVKLANDADLALPTGTCTSPSGKHHPCYIPPRYGSLINDQGTIYLITDNYRIGFASEQAFLGLGYAYQNVFPGDTSFLDSLAPINTSEMAHPSGTAINIDGTICVVQSVFQSGGKYGYRCITSLQHFYDWGYKLTDVIPANSHDRSLPMNGVIDYSPGPNNPMNL